MRAVDIITRKRDGLELSADEIDFFVQGFTKGDLPEYQAAAWLMAIYFQGMAHVESINLTMSMVRSGAVLDLSDVAPFVVDKHSSGGVGDKTTLVVAPLVAGLGIPVGKMSGRGLGFSGGTLDKLESIPGFRTQLTEAEFIEQLKRIDLVVSGQTAEFAPADGKLYALRDVTGTVPSLPLIASSIMSKKIATGSHGTVLDVKVGSGAFMREEEEAHALAKLMVRIGRGVGREVVAVISDMSQPLGFAVGNALEMKEAFETLQGRGPQDFREHCLVISEQMVLMSGKATDASQAREMVAACLDDGRAWAKFKEWISAQGGDVGYVEDPQRLPRANLTEALSAPCSGFIAGIDARAIGMVAAMLGGGRAQKGDPLDHSVGLMLQAKIGSQVRHGDPLCTIHASDASRMAQAKRRALSAYSFSSDQVQPPPLIRRIVA